MRGLYAVKPAFVRRLRPVEDMLVRRRVPPDALTAGAVVLSLAAGAAIALGGMLGRPLLWLAVPPLVLARLALNALDGSIARRTGRARPFGAALNEVGDRLSDAATVGATGIATGHHRLALGAVGCAFLASLAGVLAQAATGRRDSGGPMGKADRAALLAVGAVAGAIAGSHLPLTIVLWAVLGGSLITAAARLARLRREAARPSAAARVASGFPSDTIEIDPPAHVDQDAFDVLVR